MLSEPSESRLPDSLRAPDVIKLRDAHQPIVAFLFAHQDDEVAVFSCIEQAVRRGNRVVCIFLTNGSIRGNQSARRDTESRRVLAKFGVEPADIHFIGSAHGFSDSILHHHFDDALAAVTAILDPPTRISGLFMHAWEGGHQDHDAVHLIGAVYAAKHGLLGTARQYTLYRAATNFLGVTLFAPLAENGPVAAESMTRAARLRYLCLSLSYPSQWKSWIVLFPLLAYSYCTKPAQETQGVSIARLLTRPHVGALLYERRGYMRYDYFRAAADSFLRRHFPGIFPIRDQG